MIALYNAIGGSFWGNNHQWLSSAPIGDWHGVVVNSEGRVIGLHLTDNRLRGKISPELANLANLKELSLDGNQLTGDIPPELGYLTNLEGLSTTVADRG